MERLNRTRALYLCAMTGLMAAMATDFYRVLFLYPNKGVVQAEVSGNVFLLIAASGSIHTALFIVVGSKLASVKL